MTWTPKVHEKIVVYHDGKRYVTEVYAIGSQDLRVLITPEGTSGKTCIFVHRKQCRRLKPPVPSVRLTRKKLFAAMSEAWGPKPWEEFDLDEQTQFNGLCKILGLPTEGKP